MKNRYLKYEQLLLFSLIFIITSVLYIELAETAWYPIKQHIYVDKFRPYIIYREKPFEYFYFAFKHFHSYYVGTFFIITSLYVSMYYYLWSVKRKMSEILKFSLFVFGMFAGGFLIYIANRLYWYGFEGAFFWGFLEVFFNYLFLFLREFAVILLFILVAFTCTMLIQFLRLRKIKRIERENIRKMENLEEQVKY